MVQETQGGNIQMPKGGWNLGRTFETVLLFEVGCADSKATHRLPITWFFAS